MYAWSAFLTMLGSYYNHNYVIMLKACIYTRIKMRYLASYLVIYYARNFNVFAYFKIAFYFIPVFCLHYHLEVETESGLCVSTN